MGVTQFGYIGIGVSDIAEWEKYATEILGLQVGQREEDGSIRLRMDQYGYRFILHPSGEDDIIFAGWEVKDELALKETAEAVRAAGIKVEDATPEELEHRKVVGLVKFEDPAGLRTELYYGPHLEKVKPFASPRGVLFETGENGSMGFGHMVVNVPNVEENLRFYRDVLGLRISDYIDMQAGPAKLRFVFFHANPRHHSIAFGGPINLPPGAEMPRFGPPKRLNHFMIQTKELDDVGRAFMICQEMKAPTGQLGRHTNDHMFSFYTQTPSKFMVEYGWGGREVDDDAWEVQHYDAASIWGHTFPDLMRQAEAEAEPAGAAS